MIDLKGTFLQNFFNKIVKNPGKISLQPFNNRKLFIENLAILILNNRRAFFDELKQQSKEIKGK